MGIVDWLVIDASGCVFVGVGAYDARQNQTADDFLLGGRRMSPVLVGLSLFVTLVSPLSYLGNPGEMIAHGPHDLVLSKCRICDQPAGRTSSGAVAQNLR